MNALTHSYTIQPVISADGKLLPTLLVVLKEKDGKFGPLVQKNLFPAPNLFVVPSSSGKLSKDLVHKWITGEELQGSAIYKCPFVRFVACAK